MLGTTKDRVLEGEVVGVTGSRSPLPMCVRNRKGQDSWDLGCIYKGLQKACVVNGLEKSSVKHYLQSKILFKPLQG